MSKFKCYVCSNSPKKYSNKTYNTFDEAALDLPNWAYQEGILSQREFDECATAIKERGYYMVGYSCTELGVEEV